MTYVVYEENTNMVLAIINTEENGLCANGIKYKRYDEDIEPVFVQDKSGIVHLREDAFIFHNNKIKK